MQAGLGRDLHLEGTLDVDQAGEAVSLCVVRVGKLHVRRARRAALRDPDAAFAARALAAAGGVDMHARDMGRAQERLASGTATVTESGRNVTLLSGIVISGIYITISRYIDIVI